MKIPKCTKTVTGKHVWIDGVWDIMTGERSGSIRYTFPYEHIRCLACDMVDDRRRKSGTVNRT
jgi:hypothetical protein